MIELCCEYVFIMCEICNDVYFVRMERLQTLIPTACLEHLDFLDEDSTVLDFLALKELETDNSHKCVILLIYILVGYYK
jgi:hypothetical protein